MAINWITSLVAGWLIIGNKLPKFVYAMKSLFIATIKFVKSYASAVPPHRYKGG